MKFSKSFIQTLKEIPNDIDADNISQVLMARAGLVKRMSNGLYVHMPLFLSVMEKVEAEICRAMASVDCAEVKFPVLIQKTDLEESGRWNAFGNEIFKLKDRGGKEMALSPTSEEAACFMARNYIQSYNQLPMSLFQIQKKYRDEISPRGGVMRAREFTMKDAYSFHASDKSLGEYFLKMRDAYTRIFTNLGLKTIHVEADNGAMGGKQSREFMVISDIGSDQIGVCECGYAANIEVLADQKCDTPACLRKPEDLGKVTAKCPKCGHMMTFHKAYELGHIFALGTHYSEKLDLNYTDENGKQQILHMGCYGIGIERLIAAIIEQHHDANGIKWPQSLAPVSYNIITLNVDDPEVWEKSQKLYDEMTTKGESVLWDDRNVSAGVKLKDSDLLGIPNRIVVSKKGVSYEKR